MKPEVARADRSNTQLNNTKAYFLYEDHIGRPVLLSEYADYDTDGDTYGDGSYFMDNNEDEYPYFQVYYNLPFGESDYWFSTGITIGDLETTGIVWLVPFRFPGQYQDITDNLDMFYNWNRWYMPGMGRYTQADQQRDILNFKIKGRDLSPAFLLSNHNLINSQQMILALNLINSAYSGYYYSINNPISFHDFTGLVTNCELGCMVYAATMGTIAGALGAVFLPETLGGSLAAAGIAIGYAVTMDYGCVKQCEKDCQDNYRAKCSWGCQDELWGNVYPPECGCQK